MANYTINYSCGHGSIVKQLYGKHAERESKIEWMEKNMVCPDCYKARLAQEDAAAEDKDAAAEQKALFRAVSKLRGDAPCLSIQVKGKISQNKQALYRLGFVAEDKNSVFGMRLIIDIAVNPLPGQIAADTVIFKNWVQAMINSLTDLGYQAYGRFTDDSINQLINRAKEIAANPTEEQKKEQSDAQKQLDINAARPQWYVEMRAQHTKPYFNGKIYGKSGCYNIYINNKKYGLTDEQKKEFDAYLVKKSEILNKD